MSKKMKGVAFDSSYEDARARFKHQTLLQDYVELQQETEAAKNKLEAMKQKKLILQAEVSFLRRRHKFLLKTKSSSTPQEVIAKPIQPKRLRETTQFKKSKKEKTNSKKDTTLPNLPPIPNLNQKARVYTEKKNTLPSNNPFPSFDFDRKVKFNGLKEQSSPVSQKDRAFGNQEVVGQSRIPVFDLNEISREEEEEMQEGFEEQRRDSIRSGVEEQQNDLKLSICRNVGDASTSRSGKRKISWQDPVALRV